MLDFNECGELVEIFALMQGEQINPAHYEKFMMTDGNQQRMEVYYNNFMLFEFFCLNLEFGILPPQDFVSVFEQI